MNALPAPRALLSMLVGLALAACGSVPPLDADAGTPAIDAAPVVTGPQTKQVLSATGRMTGGDYVMSVQLGGSTQRKLVDTPK